jgi:hypothetical protein
MTRACNSTKEHRVVMPAGHCRTPWWSLMVVSVALCAGPTWAQTRVHNPNAQPKPKPAPTPPKPPAAPTSPASPSQPTSPTPTAPKPTPAPTTPTPAPQQSPAPTTPAPTPPANPTPSAPTSPLPTPNAGAAGASDSLRGLLMGRDVRAGTITIGRNGYPPVTLRVGNSAVITRDGEPAPFSELETGGRTAVPDAVIVSAAGAADGTLVAAKIKATSRDHFWYGRLTGLDPSSDTITVTRADGQRRAFHLYDRTNLIQYGAGNAEWNALRMGVAVEVVWIPGDNDDNAPVLEAHMVVLNKPYEGVKQRPPVRQ